MTAARRPPGVKVHCSMSILIDGLKGWIIEDAGGLRPMRRQASKAERRGTFSRNSSTLASAARNSVSVQS